MHQFTLDRSLAEPVLPSGTYVASDATTAEILAYNRGNCRVAQAPFFKKEIRRFDDLNGKSILLCRQGAAGDLLYATPGIRELKKRFPFATVDVACFPRFHCLFDSNPDVSNVLVNPIDVDSFLRYDVIVWLDDNWDEETKTCKEVHAVDLVLSHLGMNTENKELAFCLTDAEKAHAAIRFPRNKRRRIAAQISASEPARSWPRENLVDFTKLAIRADCEVFWIGFPNETGHGPTPPPEHLIDCTRLDPPLSIRETAALLTTCDGVVAPDSLWTCIAGALSIPCVALFAAFPSQLRSSYAKSVEAVNSRAGCNLAPCFHHSGRIGVRPFPDEGPCAVSGECDAMANIAGDRALTLLNRQIKRLAHTQMEGQ